MTSPAASAPDGLRPESHDFSLVLGGPLYQLFRRAHLADDALKLLRQRIVVLALLAWVPLLALAAADGRLLAGTCDVPFLHDVEAHARFLVALPLLVAAELVVHQRMRSVVEQFLERQIVPDRERPRFEAAIASAFRLRNSVVAEVLLVAFVYGVGVLVLWRRYISLDAATWYGTPDGGETALTRAGLWYGWVSLPLFQFLLARWYFRIFIWTRFLWQVSRLDLRLLPTHPDRLGGLSFVTATAHAFTLLAAAHGTILAGPLANRVLLLGASLQDFKAEIAVLVGILLLLIHLPFLFFSGGLADAKRTGLREYGALAERYAREFDAKWLRGGAPPGEALVGSADVQSLADMGGSFDVVREMRTVPVTRDSVVQIAVATLLPIAPLLLTMMPLEELLRTLAGVVL